MVKLSKRDDNGGLQLLLFPWSTYYCTLRLWQGAWWYGYQQPWDFGPKWVDCRATRQEAVNAALTLFPKPEGWDAMVEAEEAARAVDLAAEAAQAADWLPIDVADDAEGVH
jgi:hypothetical protein